MKNFKEAVLKIAFRSWFLAIAPLTLVIISMGVIYKYRFSHSDDPGGFIVFSIFMTLVYLGYLVDVVMPVYLMDKTEKKDKEPEFDDNQ